MPTKFVHELRAIERSQNLLDVEGLRHIHQFVATRAVAAPTVRLTRSLGKLRPRAATTPKDASRQPHQE